jgi:hypothetical protein
MSEKSWAVTIFGRMLGRKLLRKTGSDDPEAAEKVVI